MRGIRPEASHQIAHREGVTATRHVSPCLRHHGVGADPEETVEPRCGATMALGSGNARPHVHLRRGIGKRRLAVDLGHRRRRRRLAADHSQSEHQQC